MSATRARLEERYGPVGGSNDAGWPEPMRKEAFHGLAGEFVKLIDPVTEADPHGLLLSFLSAAGNAMGRHAGYIADGSFHSTAVWVVTVGRTAKARKGTAWSRTRECVALADPDWAAARIVGGLSTGEGLVFQIRDQRRERRKPKRDETPDDDGLVEDIVDIGVADKRLMVVETEFGGTFKVMSRDGNTLSSTLRTVWDHGAGGGITKNDPARVTRGHITVLGHVTLDELRTAVSDTDISGGLVNRFLWACVDRSKMLPDGGSPDMRRLGELATNLGAVIRGAADLEVLKRTREARDLWHHLYPQLTGDKPGRLGLVTGRAEAQVLRLSIVFAVLDGKDTIGVDHMRAAVAVWDYCDASAAYIFGDATGNSLADTILRALRGTPDGLTRTDIRELVGGRVKEQQLETALTLLQRNGLAHAEIETDTGGRPAERWSASTTKEEEGDR